MNIVRVGTALLLCWMTSSAFAQQHFGNGRGDRGGWDRGGHDNNGDRFDRPEHNVGGAVRLGAVDIARGRAYQVLNVNVDVSDIKLCVRRDDLNLISLSVSLQNGRTLTLASNAYIANGVCTTWLNLPGRVTQIVIVGNSDRDNRNPRVVVFGKTNHRPPPNPGRVWSSMNNQTSCGDGAGPFYRDAQNNQVHIMPCPDQKPNGGPIGLSCGTLARGTLCYGWRTQAQPGYLCSAPNGKYPPNPAYMYSMYQCL